MIVVLGSVLIGCVRPDRVEVTNNQPNMPTPQSSLESTPDDFPSDEQFEQWRKDSFQPVIDKWLRGEQLPRVVELDRKDAYAANSEHGASVELLDVNGDGKKELAMQSGCATVGNCAFWLFQRTADGYRQLLAADMVQRSHLRKTRTNKYFDLETSSHGSATSGGIAVYKYDGSEYKISECFGYEYELTGRLDRNGQAITRERPTMTSWNCENWPGP